MIGERTANGKINIMKGLIVAAILSQENLVYVLGAAFTLVGVLFTAVMKWLTSGLRYRIEHLEATVKDMKDTESRLLTEIKAGNDRVEKKIDNRNEQQGARDLEQDKAITELRTILDMILPRLNKLK